MSAKSKTENFSKGLAKRREVVGERYVQKSFDDSDDFTMPIQELVTEYCWGAVWTRPGLPQQTRSLINLAMFTALNRPHEMRVHVRGALRNGCSVEEIRETLLQATVYCGFPAGLDAFRTAREVIREAQEKGLD